VPSDELLEPLDGPQKALRRLEVPDVVEDVRFGPDELVRLGEDGGATVLDDLLRYPADQGVGRDPRERVRPPALQGELQLRQGLLGATHGVHLGEPAAQDLLAPLEVLPEAPPQAHELVRHVHQGIAVLLHVGAEHPVADRPSLFVHHEHGPDVRVHHEAAQSAQQDLQVVGRVVLASLRVSHGDHAVHVLVPLGEVVEPHLQHLRVGVGSGVDAQDQHVIPGTHPAATGPPVAHECARLVVERHRRAGPKALLVELVGRELGVAEVRFPGQYEMEVAKAARDPARALVVRPVRLIALATGRDRMALAQHAQDLLVADVVPGRDVLDRPPER
jgi:hypothetical protein